MLLTGTHPKGKPGLAGALMRRHLEQGDLLFKGLLDEASELTDQQYLMAPLVSHDTRALLFIAVIEGGILLTQNLDQNQLPGSQVLAYRAFLRMLYGANQAVLRL